MNAFWGKESSWKGLYGARLYAVVSKHSERFKYCICGYQ